eukprot:TRINITY_DN84_c0_g2_i1.p1 TRINITY_DN84_c0_g2~~TRINITY_DN84_c0_g2_i1.p1  ORF type:complete len:296 (-),score=79.01 TRINITY_DN84_c0_g2_i1:97-870(-)
MQSRNKRLQMGNPDSESPAPTPPTAAERTAETAAASEDPTAEANSLTPPQLSAQLPRTMPSWVLALSGETKSSPTSVDAATQQRRKRPACTPAGQPPPKATKSGTRSPQQRASKEEIDGVEAHDARSTETHSPCRLPPLSSLLSGTVSQPPADEPGQHELRNVTRNLRVTITEAQWKLLFAPLLPLLCCITGVVDVRFSYAATSDSVVTLTVTESEAAAASQMLQLLSLYLANALPSFPNPFNADLLASGTITFVAP